KKVVITGASQGGIGAETAVALAYGKPSSLVLAGRSTSDIKPTIERIREVDPTVEVVCIDLDLSDQVSVRSAVDQVKSKFEKLDILINNAAVMCVYPYRETKQGIEMQFGTNHVGHFLWTNLLLPLLTRSERGGARIINVSSTGYVLHDVPDDVNFNVSTSEGNLGGGRKVLSEDYFPIY
ncbi:NAD(P)-binding protein, partial [Violaceomyces palustris]